MNSQDEISKLQSHRESEFKQWFSPSKGQLKELVFQATAIIEGQKNKIIRLEKEIDELRKRVPAE